MMLVEALNSLNDSAPSTGSPASSSSDRMPKATVEAELPFFKPNYQFRRVATLWVSSLTVTRIEPFKLTGLPRKGHFLNSSYSHQPLSLTNS